jgi:putative ABC transport system permease protein
MNIFSQIGAVTSLSLQTLPQRLGTSSVIVIGIAGVVAVLVSVLAMSTGMLETLEATGRDDRAIVLRSGGAGEITSYIARSQTRTIMDADAIERDARGQPIASAETLSMVLLTKKDGSEVSVPMRGVGNNAEALRPEIKIIRGRMFTPAAFEVIVGRGASAQYSNLDVGTTFRLRDATWKVVGIFETNGDSHESELLTNAETLQGAIGRIGSFQSVTVTLKSPEQFTAFKDSLTSDPSLSVEVIKEREFFAQQSSETRDLLTLIAYLVGSIMGIGAIFSALNTMYSAVSARTVEIATLRALGFGASPIVVSILVEAMLLGALGGAIGAGIGWLFFNGNVVSSAAGGVGMPSRVFSLHVSPALVMLGVGWALIIGLIGGMFPAVRAARMPITYALRAVGMGMGIVVSNALEVRRGRPCAGAAQVAKRCPASRARPRGGGCGSSPRWVRIFSITGRSRMAAMILSSPAPQFGQCCMSMSNTCFNS